VSKILSTLLDTPLVCVYQAEAEYPQLRKVATVEGVTPVFPEILPASELANLDSDLLWSPGKRVVSEAQRAGRMEKLAYVLEVPLGQPGALVGLIVAADRHHSLPERNVRVLGLLGSAISSILQQLQLVRKLQEDIAHWEDHRRVWDAVVENDVAGVIVLKPDLTITEMNLAAEELLEYPGGEVIGHLVDTVLISTDRILPTLEAALQGVQTPNLGMLSLHRRSGQVFPAHVQVVPVMAGDEVSAIIIYILDISDEEAIRARTQQLEHRAVLGEVTAMFAHEVRNPINNLWTGVQLLATRLDESDVNQELIARMDSDCNRLNHLMEDVLAYSRPYDPRMEETDLVNLLKRICDRWRPRIARKNLQFFFKAEEEIPNIIADTRALDQVFTNLISNAIEAMADNGGMLAVGVGMNIIENRPHVEVTVTDNGPGIPEDVKERIFEPFVTTKQLGTGLGLAITKRIVNAHRGTIICNTYPGCTVFHILLPTAEGD
jgi:PAS domain S-box-containing protein